MSADQVDVVRKGFEAVEAKDLDALTACFAEDAVIYSVPDWPDDAQYRGHEGVRRLMTQWEAALEDFAMGLDELRDAGDVVVARFHLSGRIGGSSLATEYGAVFTVRDGRVAVQRLCATWADALREAGVST
jgi:ketosteroid isomerase-like protein